MNYLYLTVGVISALLGSSCQLCEAEKPEPPAELSFDGGPKDREVMIGILPEVHNVSRKFRYSVQG